MKQGYSGSTVQQKGKLVEKVSSDRGFIKSKKRQRDLIALSQKIDVLPTIEKIEKTSIYMEFVAGKEGLTIQNAQRAGMALRLLHDQRGYPHPCFTGLAWLIELANENLALFNDTRRISPEMIEYYPNDSLIHSEPGQFIEKKDGSIVFIDFEGIGMGSRYQDLGQIYYGAIKEDRPELYTKFIEGYLSDPVQIDLARVKQLAGIISLSYAGFGLTFVGREEFEKRMRLGFRLLDETGW